MLLYVIPVRCSKVMILEIEILGEHFRAKGRNGNFRPVRSQYIQKGRELHGSFLQLPHIVRP